MGDSVDIQRSLQEALQRHGAGELGEAERMYRSILASNPRQADALHYLGVIGLQTGRFEEAVSLIGQAIEIRPDDADAQANLGNALQAVGRFDDAADSYRKALGHQPGNASVIANLGNAQLQGDDPAAAIESYRAALTLEPRLVDARRSLADALLSLGRPSEAYAEIRSAAKLAPMAPGVLVSMGNVLSELGRSDEAIACFEKVLSSQPDMAPVICNLASVLRQNGQLSDAIEHYERALQLAPDYSEGYYDLGIALQDLGEKHRAQVEFRKALDIDPHCGKAWRAIAGLSRDALSSDDFDRMENALRQPDARFEERMHLEFALGKGYENAGDHEKSITHVHRGNRLRRASFDYSIEDEKTLFENLRRRIDKPFLDRWSEVGVEDATPIFIVGMPRSGTTLTEQILASHPLVHGGGELRYLARAISERFPLRDGVDYTPSLGNAGSDDFTHIAARYLQQIRFLDDAARHITDKLPNNFLNVGLIRVLFPNARIIHCVRDARDTCYSIYKHYFSARGHYYAYEMSELGQYYRLYSDLMAHWGTMLPGVMHELRYESLVGAQEATTRALLEFCDLPWDAACLEFHKTRRPVATISASQVRQPMYNGSVGAWRHFEDELRPLLEALEDSP